MIFECLLGGDFTPAANSDARSSVGDSRLPFGRRFLAASLASCDRLALAFRAVFFLGLFFFLGFFLWGAFLALVGTFLDAPFFRDCFGGPPSIPAVFPPRLIAGPRG